MTQYFFHQHVPFCFEIMKSLRFSFSPLKAGPSDAMKVSEMDWVKSSPATSTITHGEVRYKESRNIVEQSSTAHLKAWIQSPKTRRLRHPHRHIFIKLCQDTKMLCDLFFCLQLRLRGNVGIGTLGCRHRGCSFCMASHVCSIADALTMWNASESAKCRMPSRKQLHCNVKLVDPRYPKVLRFWIIWWIWWVDDEQPRVVRKKALCSVQRSNSKERRWLVLSQFL